jgi:hypothetical protein
MSTFDSLLCVDRGNVTSKEDRGARIERHIYNHHRRRAGRRVGEDIRNDATCTEFLFDILGGGKEYHRGQDDEDGKLSPK